LVALHLACQALRAVECSLALVGGVTIMTTPGELIGFSQQRGLAQDGRCKAFSAAADGMGMGEGVGMLVVERLSDARRNGHQVLAVVRGSAVNQDGASNGLTAPNGPSQQRVIRAALANARVSADQVDAVEGHGSGTVLGDPIEVQALLAAYGQSRDPERPLWLGSVKSNIGHAQAAAGVAGIIKVVLALRHGLLPPTLHIDEPSPHVEWTGSVRLLTEPTPWPVNERSRLAGVSSFGFSGTNAHAILEEAPANDRTAAETDSIVGDTERQLAPGSLAWLLSGRTADGLRAQAEQLTAYLSERQDLEPADVGWSLAVSRSVFEHRAVVTGGCREDLLAGLAAVAAGEPAAGVVTGIASVDADRVVFVFPGQGGQWPQMAAELARSCPAFAGRLAECVAALQPHVDWPVAQVLREAGEEALEKADVVQPLLWAVMVALAAAWEWLGVVPDAVAGHSQGEIAAATVAGMLPLAEAARVVAVRSKALAGLPAGGAMAAVAWPAGTAQEAVAGTGGRVWVAAVNGPASVVLAGDREVLAAVTGRAEAAG
ncbi:MAG TPA: type I polyketide synthase, partial [Streptosporangiaceae bacterium]|nr:type I polyketide synthase [Streptosporangiaceae bacterium]